jgi:hypothetical protein
MNKPYEGALLEFEAIPNIPLEKAPVDTRAAPPRATTLKLKLLTAVLLSGIAWAPAVVAQSYAPPGYGYGPGAGAYGPGYGRGTGNMGTDSARPPQALPAPTAQQIPVKAEAGGLELQIRRADEALAQENVAQARQILEQVLLQIEQTSQQPDGAREQVTAPFQEQVRLALEALEQENANEARQALRKAAQQLGSQGGEAFSADHSTMVAIDVPEPVVTVTQSDPTVRIKQSPAQVEVDPGRPQITINQPAPQVNVHMPQPVITIDMPHPQILVDMPNPTVSATVPQPEVSVDQPAPTVTVTQGKPEVRIGSEESQRPSQADVRVERGQAQVIMGDAQQATVSVSEAMPQVRYAAAQPEVQVVSEGEPQVQFTQSGEATVQVRQQGANEPRETAEQQSSPEPRETRAQLGQAAQPAADHGQTRDDANTAVSARATRDMQITVGRITDYAIVDIHGASLGDIEKVVNVDNRLYAVTKTGGFLGFGTERVAIALSSLVFSNDALQSEGDSPSEIETLDGFQSADHPALQDNFPVTIGRM